MGAMKREPPKAKLWLDDERPAPAGWIAVKTALEAIQVLKEQPIDEVSLDHDLGTEMTGYDVLLWIEEKVFTDDRYAPPQLHIHTANSSARKKMKLAIRSITDRLSARP